MLTFQTTIHARSADVAAGAELEIGGRRVKTLAVSPESVSTPFEISFEDAAARLEQLERMFFEPDGSLVWASPQEGPDWQIDGNLFDRNGKLQFVDLKGNCPAEQFDRLLTALGWPATPLMFQLTREAVFLGEVEFRRFCSEG